MLLHHTNDEKAWIVPLINQIRRRLSFGQTREQIFAELTAPTSNPQYAEGDVYLCYVAALVLDGAYDAKDS